MIQERREEVIADNNTAQTQLTDILEKTNKRETAIYIDEPLYGDVDFSIIRNMGFGQLNAIYLPYGSITSVANLPEGLEIFECPGNLLISLDNLPSSIKQLIINDNYLTTIDLSQTRKLEILIVSNNQIKEIENLPETLINFYCENNRLQRLNLLGLSKLQVLNISNNTITVIENMPKGIADFKMENTPSIEFRNIDTDAIASLSVATNKEDKDAAKRSYVESLNEYFKIKQNYENQLYKMKRKIHNQASSHREAKQIVRKIKPLCIKCKRPVGTCFSKKDNRYIAVCGDEKNPCKLDIQIFVGNSNPLNWILYAYKDADDDYKDEIIMEKNEILFGYIPESVAEEWFKKKMDEYTKHNKLYKEVLDKYKNIYNNPHKTELINEKMERIFILNERIRVLLEEYKQTNNTEIIKTAMNIQVNELLPETRNLRMLKYKIMEMKKNVISKNLTEHNLVQLPFAYNELDEEYGEPQRVIKFVI